MSLGTQDMTPEPSLVAENARIAARFVSEGIDLDRVAGMSFFCDFASEAEARAYLSAVKGNCDALGFAPPFARVEMDVCALPWFLEMHFDMAWEVQEVSRLEQSLQALADTMGGGTVSWEIADPDTAEQADEA